MRYDATKDLKINYQINHALWLLEESNEEDVNQTEYRIYIQQYANSKEEFFTFQNKEAAMKLYDEASEINYHTHIEYYLDGKFQYNVCGSCKREYIHNPDEELDR